MIGFKKTAMVALLAGLGFTGASQASLVARAGGMVYDTVYKITWTADANLFKTQAAGNANLVSEIIAGNGGIILDTPNYYNPSGTYELTTADFNTDSGAMTWWGAQAWANNLSLGGYTDWSLSTTVPPAVYNYTLFTNLYEYVYWSSIEFETPSFAWYFNTGGGYQVG